MTEKEEVRLGALEKAKLREERRARDRERVEKYSAQGLTDRQIAVLLRLSKTVVRDIRKSLGITAQPPGPRLAMGMPQP